MTEKNSNQGVNFHLLLAVTAAVIGSAFQHGYNTGVLNAPQQLIENFINESYVSCFKDAPSQEHITLLWSCIVSVFCIGGMIGGFLAGSIADRFGRKGGLLVNNVLAITAGVLFQFSKFSGSYVTLIIGRLIIGINCGLNAGLGPLYLSEISPRRLRGAIGTVYQLVVTISILIAQILGMSFVLGTESRWPSLLGLIIFPAILELCLLPFCPESPKFYLMNCKKENEAYEALCWLRYSDNIEDEFRDLKDELSSIQKTPGVSLKDMFVKPTLKTPLVIAVTMMMAQQFSGINAVIFFSTDIFMSAGLPEHAAQLGTIGIGATNVMMTLISMTLIERLGRKTLMLSGLIVMFTTCLLLTASLILQKSLPWMAYVCILLVIVFVIGFATGPGSIPWFLVTELFNQSSRPMATSIAVGVNWTANFCVGIGFLPLANVFGSYVFLIFGCLLLVFIVFTIYKVPETRNKTFEEISEKF